MRADLTDITVVMDRSGSMSTCRVEAENGLNAFIQKQREQPGEALFTLIQFDTEYEVVHSAVPMNHVPKCKLIPRGMTALLDAVGKSIVQTGERLSSMKEEDRPGLVVFVIITDGMENSSQEYKEKSIIKNMIETQRKDYNWQFTFLGANQDAFQEAASMGIPRAGAAVYAAGAPDSAFDGASASVSRMRSSSKAGARIVNAYTEAELKDMADKK